LSFPDFSPEHFLDLGVVWHIELVISERRRQLFASVVQVPGGNIPSAGHLLFSWQLSDIRRAERPKQKLDA
jgi:hypothetical protein